MILAYYIILAAGTLNVSEVNEVSAPSAVTLSLAVIYVMLGVIAMIVIHVYSRRLQAEMLEGAEGSDK